MELKHRDQLPEFLRYLNLNNKGVELGTFNGSFSKHLINNWSGILYMVDVWRPLSFDEYDDSSNHANNQEAYKNAMNNIKGFEDRAFMLRMKGEFACELFKDNSLDFVYIDANHIMMRLKKILKTGIQKLNQVD
jgi:hypothetical protein